MYVIVSNILAKLTVKLVYVVPGVYKRNRKVHPFILLHFTVILTQSGTDIMHDYLNEQFF